MLQAAFPTAIGDSISASLPTESKINVVKVEPTPDKAGKEVQVTLNAADACLRR